jgi:putative transposase
VTSSAAIVLSGVSDRVAQPLDRILEQLRSCNSDDRDAQKLNLDIVGHLFICDKFTNIGAQPLLIISVDILKQAEGGVPVPELCREHGISSATFYKWRAKYGGMDASLMTYVKQLEEENRRLKKMYAEEKIKAEIVADGLKKKW